MADPIPPATDAEIAEARARNADGRGWPVTAENPRPIERAIDRLLARLERAESERDALLARAPHRPFDVRAADVLADEVAVLVRRKVIGSRSPAADALLDYGWGRMDAGGGDELADAILATPDKGSDDERPPQVQPSIVCPSCGAHYWARALAKEPRRG